MSRFSIENFQEIAPLLETNFCTGLKAGTGIGKSSYFPPYLEQYGATVFITQPTIPATVGLEQRVSSIYGKDKIGWAAEGDVHYSNSLIDQLRGKDRNIGKADTPIVYCTQGHMRRIIVSFIKSLTQQKNDNFGFATFLMLDEAHIGSADYEVIMALLNYAKVRGVRIPRLILSSATLNIKNTPFPNSPVYEIIGKSLPVTIEYHNRDYKTEVKNLYRDLAAKVMEKHQRMPLPEKGDGWMVFCAGVADINAMKNYLVNIPNMEIFTAYSNMNLADVKLIFEPPKAKTRKVILATNIAEASITVEGLSGIFDCMTEKIAETSSSGGIRLVVKNISKSSAEQRKGRTGRTVSGFCYRMCTQRFFDDLPTSQAKEIERVPLHNIFIELFDAGVQPKDVFDTKILNPKKTKDTIDLLKYLNAVSKDGSITELGRFLPTVPLSVRNGTILWKWLHPENGQKYPAFPVIVCLAMLDCYSPSYFFYPPMNPGQDIAEYRDNKMTYWEINFMRYDATSHIGVFLNMWDDIYNTFQEDWKKHGYFIPKRELVEFCNKRSFNHVKIREFMKIVEQIMNELARQKYNIVIGKFNHDNFLIAFEPILFDVYRDSLAKKQYLQNFLLNGEEFILDKNNLINDFLYVKSYQEVYSLMTFETKSQNRSTTRILTLYHPSNRNELKTFDKPPPVVKEQPLIQKNIISENEENYDEDYVPEFEGQSPAASVITNFSNTEMMSPPYNTEVSPPYNTVVSPPYMPSLPKPLSPPKLSDIITKNNPQVSNIEVPNIEVPKPQVPNITLPTSKLQITLPTSKPQITLSTSKPQITLPTSKPQITLPTPKPQITLPTSKPQI